MDRWAGINADQSDGHGRVVHRDPQMRRAGCGGNQLSKRDGIKEFDTVITPEISSFVMPVIRIGLRIALRGMDDERTLSLGEFSVREKVNALVADQPQTGSGLGFRGYSLIRQAKSAVCGRVGPTVGEHSADVGEREGEHAALPHAACRSGR